ncbi:MAG TPA: hypothetical protein VLL48_08885, partial [Longimicrobiales bacterium]|nr:hypothetical protein [Longimicrobiales bacterium]
VPEVRAEVARLLQEPAGAEIDPQYQLLAILDAHLLDQRYHQAAASLMARVWARYLGFITGMILALVGAVFILGKLREGETTWEASGGGYSAGLRSSSPGLIMAVLGVVLMVVTIISHHEIETADSSVFLRLAEPKPGEVVLPDSTFP